MRGEDSTKEKGGGYFVGRDLSADRQAQKQAQGEEDPTDPLSGLRNNVEDDSKPEACFWDGGR